MKILHVNDKYTLQGGVQQYILSVRRLLTDNGHSNVILYTEQLALTIQNGAWPAYHIQTGANIAAQVQKILDIEQPDVAYIHQVSSPALIEFLADRLPSVAYVHGVTAVCPGLGKYFRRGDTVCTRPFGWGCIPMHYLRRCSAARNPRTLAQLMRNTAGLKHALIKVPKLLVGSSYMVNLLVQNGFAAGRISVLAPHFVDDDFNLTYTSPEEPDTILYVGRLEIEKGFPYLLAVLADLPSTVHLIAAGDGTQRTHYEKMAHEFGVEGRIEFLGWMTSKSMNGLYQRSSLITIPSIIPESFGKVGIEALAHGRPVVAFDVGGVSDWLKNDVNGVLVEPRSTTKLAHSIRSLLNDVTRCNELGRNGQRMVAERYRASDHLVELMRTFESVRQAHART